MVFKRKSSKRKTKKKSEPVVSASDFQVKAATVIGSVDVSGVTGTTQFGSARNYTAYVNTTVTEVSASVNAVLDSVVTSSGHSLAIETTLPAIINTATVTNSVPTEVMSTISCGGTGVSACGLTDSGTLSLVTSVSTVALGTLSIDVSAGVYTVTDDSSGSLTSSPTGITGDVNYTTGAWSVTSSEILTNGTVLSGDYDVSYLWSETATPVVIRHSVGDDADYTGTASGVLSALVLDPAAAGSLTSSTFTVSTDSVPDDNPWKGRGALPGETALETTGRFISEGII